MKIVRTVGQNIVLFDIIILYAQKWYSTTVLMLVVEIIDSGPMCITDLFQNKCLAYFNQKLNTFQNFLKNLTFMLCNFLVRTLQYF